MAIRRIQLAEEFKKILNKANTGTKRPNKTQREEKAKAKSNRKHNTPGRAAPLAASPSALMQVSGWTVLTRDSAEKFDSCYLDGVYVRLNLILPLYLLPVPFQRKTLLFFFLLITKVF